MAETFINFLQLIEPTKIGFDDNEILNLVHILFLWQIEKKHNSIYISQMTRLLNILIQPPHVETLINVFVKLNIFSIYNELNNRIALNYSLRGALHPEELLVFIRTLVYKVNDYFKLPHSKNNQLIINSLNSWLELRDDVT
jgi:hypothetical protein